MNPPEFHGSKNEKDKQVFLNNVQQVTKIMGASLVKSVDMATY